MQLFLDALALNELADLAPKGGADGEQLRVRFAHARAVEFDDAENFFVRPNGKGEGAAQAGRYRGRSAQKGGIGGDVADPGGFALRPHPTWQTDAARKTHFTSG